jgi:hypothetical protein
MRDWAHCQWPSHAELDETFSNIQQWKALKKQTEECTKFWWPDENLVAVSGFQR